MPVADANIVTRTFKVPRPTLPGNWINVFVLERLVDIAGSGGGASSSAGLTHCPSLGEGIVARPHKNPAPCPLKRVPHVEAEFSRYVRHLEFYPCVRVEEVGVIEAAAGDIAANPALVKALPDFLPETVVVLNVPGLYPVVVELVPEVCVFLYL